MAHGPSSAWRRRIRQSSLNFAADYADEANQKSRAGSARRRHRFCFFRFAFICANPAANFAGRLVHHLDRSQRFAREFLFQINVTLLAGNQIAQHFLNAAMPAGKLDHSFRERRAAEISIEAPAHL